MYEAEAREEWCMVNDMVQAQGGCVWQEGVDEGLRGEHDIVKAVE